MIITREPRSEPQDRCVINLERDFPNREQAIAFIFEQDLLHHPELKNELYNADDPNVWIVFTVNRSLSILSIGLS